MHTLKINSLTVKIDKKIILNKFSLTINSGEIHAILGPNGVGKSTLLKVIMGDKNYKITSGKIMFDDCDITNLPTDERANLGLFLAFQMPTSIEGVSLAEFLRTAMHNKEKKDFKLLEFIRNLNKECDKLKMDKEMIHRSINVGFSGGERKKNEILQMNILKPKMLFLDEIDSGLDIDSLKIVGEAIKKYIKEENPGVLLITHYERLLDTVEPTHVHIMGNGHIIKSGDRNLINEIEEKGYEQITMSSNE